MSALSEYFNIRWVKLYGIVLGLYLLNIWLSQSLVNEIVYYNTYSEQLTYDRAVELYGVLKRNAWISYICFPIIILAKITAVTLILYSGVIFFNLQKQLSLGKMFQVVTGSEIIFVFAGVIKVLWFCFFAGNYTLNDISFFYPASLISLFNPLELDKIWIFPLQTLNLFHFVYFLLLIYGIKVTGEIDKNYSEKIVAGTYIPAMIIWVSLIMFLTISPEL
jgi:hypothetical protein